MSINERRTSFVPAGAACWPLATTPDWRGGRNGWWGAEAVWDFDAKAARYMAGGSDVPLTSLVSTMRSSAHLLADAGGAYQSFGNNMLARVTGIGAYIGAQATNAVASPNDLSSGSWTQTGSPSIAADGDFWAVTDATAAATSTIRQTAIAITADTAVRTVWVDLKKDSNNTIFACVQFNFTGAVDTWRQIVLNTSTGAAAYHSSYGSAGVSIRDLGDRWRVIWTYTNQNNTTFRIWLNPAWTDNWASTNDNVLAAQRTTSFGWPHLVTGGYPGDNFRVNGTRLASAVTAAGMTWFAPLDGIGATEIVAPKWSHVGDGVNRPLFEYVKDANNYIRGYVNASDKPALKIVTGGVTQTDTAMTVSIVTGRQPLAFGWSAAGGYIGDAAGNVATFGAVTLPGGLTSNKVGSSQAGEYLNDVIERMTAYRLRTQAQALALAAVA